MNYSTYLDLYNELFQKLDGLPKLTIKKRKSYAKMIVFCNRRNFAYISLLDDNGAFMKEGFKIVFRMNSKISDTRIQTITEPHPGCFSHHTIMKTKSDMDEQLYGWLKESYELAN